MGQIKVKAAAILDAPPEDVRFFIPRANDAIASTYGQARGFEYATIADYQHGHPNILPRESLYDLRVERGGYGAGTIIRFKVKALGVEQAFYQRVSEPEPGRVLVEQDIDSVQNVVTTFTVTPVEHEQKSHVEIDTTTMNTSPGFKGLLERIIVPILNPRVYRKELKLLEAVAQKS